MTDFLILKVTMYSKITSLFPVIKESFKFLTGNTNKIIPQNNNKKEENRLIYIDLSTEEILFSLSCQ